jgi:thioesterase domain-containing protein
MVPSFVELLDQFPVTPNGKTDRKALERRTPSARKVASASVPPRTDTERVIAQTWERFLGIKELGVSDDLFEVGAHSLMIVQVIHVLNTSFNLRFGVSDIFENPTVERLAAIIERERPRALRDVSIVELREGGAEVPIYFIYSGSVEVTLARSIAGEHPVYGIELPWPLEWRKAVTANQTALFPTMDVIVDRLVGALSSHLRTGKCVLAGYSFAGVLAFEVARRLSRLGDLVEVVVIIDKWMPYPPIHSVAWTSLVNCWKTRPADATSLLSLLPTRLARSGLILCWVIESFVRTLASSLWLRPNQLTEFLDEDGFPLRWYLVERLYREIERHYKLEPLDCKGIVLRPEFLDRRGVVEAPAEYLRWGKMFKRGSQDLTVMGDHFSMVRAHARSLAQRISDAIKSN